MLVLIIWKRCRQRIRISHLAALVCGERLADVSGEETGRILEPRPQKAVIYSIVKEHVASGGF